ncbi:hypothetical protein FIBSPDRAFT_883967 [Athelia psychrophila]|uniref:MYND-type domain-containing protein n=1 Tax=Athelia psychrophila TaxID=1759441 RepID=A0A166TQA1_9AGAM|nr:hypothetical protein FIBSPDRAFT_883967 [Fibularhizoctonia sp. CBS 109695]
MYMLLSQTTQEIQISVIKNIQEMLDAWPTIWIWIRLLNGRAIHVRKKLTMLSEAQITTERGIYMVLVETLLVFLGHNSYGTQSASNKLTTIVKGTDGVLQMMATSWIEEARNEGGAMGYNSTKIFHGSLSNFRSEMELLVIAGCGGSAKETLALTPVLPSRALDVHKIIDDQNLNSQHYILNVVNHATRPVHRADPAYWSASLAFGGIWRGGRGVAEGFVRDGQSYKTAFRRIAHNFDRLRYQIHFQPRESTAMHFHLGQDVVFVADIFDRPSSALDEGLRAHPGWVKAFLDIISYFLSAPHHPAPHHPPGNANQPGIIITSMNAVYLYIDKIQAYRGPLELLESSFLDVISKASISAHKVLDVDQLNLFTGYCSDLIKIKIRHGLVYRSVLRRTERGLKDIAVSTWTKGNNLKAPMATMLLDLQSNSAPLVEAYNAFRKGPPPIFCCGNRACKSTDSGDGTLYRCCGCKLALYCGADCQKQDWRDMHKSLCNAMKQPGQSCITPDSAGHLTTLPVLRWGTQTHFVKLTDQSGVAATKFLPSGKPREAWCHSLRPRQSGALRLATTVAVLILLPPQVGKALGSMTALLTFPMEEYVKLEERDRQTSRRRRGAEIGVLDARDYAGYTTWVNVLGWEDNKERRIVEGLAANAKISLHHDNLSFNALTYAPSGGGDGGGSGGGGGDDSPKRRTDENSRELADI